MATLASAFACVLFLWWFSTGAVLLAVAAGERHETLLKWAASALFVTALAGVAVSSRSSDAWGVCSAFTCAILVWAAVEISLLTGWVTGPRPASCPGACSSAERAWFAIQAIAYHEFLIFGSAALVFAVGTGTSNQFGWWTFALLLTMRLSAKVNLFLGVRTLNDELLPRRVKFISSYFARKPINWLFPFSAVSTSVGSLLLAVAAMSALSESDRLGFSLLSGLVALGAVEHWFMVMPVPVVALWRWSMRSDKRTNGPTAPVIVAVVPARPAIAKNPGKNPSKNPGLAARERLEQQFRREYLEAMNEGSGGGSTHAAAASSQPAISASINRTILGSVP